MSPDIYNNLLSCSIATINPKQNTILSANNEMDMNKI